MDLMLDDSQKEAGLVPCPLLVNRICERLHFLLSQSFDQSQSADRYISCMTVHQIEINISKLKLMKYCRYLSYFQANPLSAGLETTASAREIILMSFVNRCKSTLLFTRMSLGSPGSKSK